MWTSDRGRSLLALGIFCLWLIATDAGFAAFARRHYLPARKLEGALSTPGVDALLVGDSRMAAALDLSGFRDGWRECGGRAPMVADLSLGGVEIDGQAVA